MHSVFENFRNHLQKKLSAENSAVIDHLSPNLVSPFILRLPKKVLSDAQNIVTDLHTLYHSPVYRDLVQPSLPFQISQVQQTPSILSSLDVHINSAGDLKIIEINTNASSYLVNAENYEVRGISTFPKAKESLRKIFSETFKEHLKPGQLFLILDQTPEKQNLYAEFLLFKDFIQKEFSVECAIGDPQDLHLSTAGTLLWEGREVSGIYNRYTDFYFAHSDVLMKAFAQGKTLISPNPLGYGLLADKKRFFDLTSDFFEKHPLPYLQNALLEAKKFSTFPSQDELWKNRARYFFKPPNSFGGKAVYRGKSISRTVFQRIYDGDGGGDYIAQELVPAPECQVEHQGVAHEFKYDLRFYFFEGEIQLAAARFYQGQLTNLKTPLGGLTPIEFNK